MSVAMYPPGAGQAKYVTPSLYLFRSSLTKSDTSFLRSPCVSLPSPQLSPAEPSRLPWPPCSGPKARTLQSAPPRLCLNSKHAPARMSSVVEWRLVTTRRAALEEYFDAEEVVGRLERGVLGGVFGSDSIPRG